MPKINLRRPTMWALGLALIAAPSLFDIHSPLSSDSSYAAAGGNGGGNGNSGGNGGGNGGGNSGGNNGSVASAEHGGRSSLGHKEHSSSKLAKTEVASTSKGKGKIASKLGALNAAHASATALAHASKNSRVGKIAAYKDATTKAADADSALKAAQEKMANLNAAVSGYNTALADVATAEQELADAVDPTSDELQSLQDAVDSAKTKAEALKAAADAAASQVSAAQSALDQAVADAAAAAEIVDQTLNAAANKPPVDAETKTALDALLANK